MTRAKISHEARADLDHIWGFIAARASAEVATEFLGRFHKTFASIASSPRAGVDVPDFPPGDIRRFPMGNYLIYYRLVRERIVIVRALHGKRAQKKAFLRKPKV